MASWRRGVKADHLSAYDKASKHAGYGTFSQDQDRAITGRAPSPWDRRHCNCDALTNGQYYRPWDLRPDEDERIKQQVEETERLVEKELADTTPADVADAGPAEVVPHSPKPSRTSAEPAKPDDDDVDATVEDKGKPPELVGEAANEQDAIPEPRVTNEVPSVEQSPPTESKKKVEDKPHDDHGGEELVEGQEDDVIY